MNREACTPLQESPPCQCPVPPSEMAAEEALRQFEIAAAAEICGKATAVINNQYMIRLYCKRFRVCPRCREFRVKTWQKRLRTAIHKLDTKEGRRIPWQYKTFGHKEAKIVRRALDYYFSFPMENDVTVVVSPGFSDGEPVPILDFSLKLLCENWVMTPEGMRPSRSSYFVERDPPDKPKASVITVGADMEYVAAAIERVNGVVIRTTSDKWEFVLSDSLELAFELLLGDKLVKMTTPDSGLSSLCLYDSMFDEIRERRAKEVNSVLL